MGRRRGGVGGIEREARMDGGWYSCTEREVLITRTAGKWGVCRVSTSYTLKRTHIHVYVYVYIYTDI